MKKRFLVEEYSKSKGEEEPKIRVVYENEVWNIIQCAWEEKTKIAVSEISDFCLIDWS